MSSSLPSSLTPHVAVFASEELAALLVSNGLPPLHQILENFSPLGQVITRTTTLVPITHASFSLRFSALRDLENTCREDEEARASRTIDWIGGRIARKAAGWVAEYESKGKRDPINDDNRWWKELRLCVDGDRAPARGEGWNHPVAVIMATTTMSLNPLQAVTTLHTRQPEFPPWVDPNVLRYTLIIHPTSVSSLSTDEATALINATKKQFGLHCHLLTLKLNKPSEPKPLVLIPPQLPQPTMFPVTPGYEAAALPAQNGVSEVHLDGLYMSDEDTVNTTRFVREFVTQSLIPWMERCVMEWNEVYSSSRRLPSRLFSSTRRLFGSGAPTPAPSTPVSPVGNPNMPFSNSPHSLSQHRRLAEFATFLGDFKFAVPLWESIRKEGKGGSDVLPMLLAPSLTLEAHAAYALAPVTTGTALGGKEGVSVGASAQLRALAYAVRWEQAVEDILGLGGEKWLVWAAGSTEEAPMALLIARAASMSLRKSSRRIAAMWYIFAANILEKCGVKALTMHFLRRAHELYIHIPDKQLSPSFTDIEGKRPPVAELDSILPSIEHSLGRMLYTTGDVISAVRLFLGLLRGSIFVAGVPTDTDRVCLEDFRIAYEHLQRTESLPVEEGHLTLPVPICQASLTRRRFAAVSSRGGDPVDSDAATSQVLEELEERWKSFWRASPKQRKEALEKSNSAEVGEKFWVDVVLRNPLDTEISLTDVTLCVREVGRSDDSDAPDGIEVESIPEISLNAKELRTMSFFIRASRVISLEVTSVHYRFLSLLPIEESLGVRGRRLNDTPAQRESPSYAKDVLMQMDVRRSGGRLHAELSPEARQLTALGVGEFVKVSVKVTNVGSTGVRELWAVFGESGNGGLVWPTSEGSDVMSTLVTSSNTLSASTPSRISLEDVHGPVLEPGQSFELHLLVQAHVARPFELAILFVFRENSQSTTFFTTFLRNTWPVDSILEVVAGVRPLAPQHLGYSLALDMENVGSSGDVKVTHVSSVSAGWGLVPKDSSNPSSQLPSLPERQMATLIETIERPETAPNDQIFSEFVLRKMGDVLTGTEVGSDPPPAIDLLIRGRGQEDVSDLRSAPFQHFVQASRRQRLLQSLQVQFPLIPSSSYPLVFPLYTPQDFDVVVSWTIPSQGRSGFTLVTGLTLGAQHGSLNQLLLGVEQGTVGGGASNKKSRNMYAETTREKEALIHSVRNSSWNMNEDPLVVDVQAADQVQHDFAARPASIPITFQIRNISAYRATEYSLLLSGDQKPANASRTLVPPYVGTLTHRGTIPPLSQKSIRTRIWVVRPGVYSLAGWRLHSRLAISEGELLASSTSSSSSTAMTFMQDGEGGAKVVVVSDVPR